MFGPILALAAIALGYYFNSRPGTAVPAQSADTGPTSQDVNPDLSGYPIHGAPAVIAFDGGRTNLLATPSPTTAKTPASTAKTPTNSSKVLPGGVLAGDNAAQWIAQQSAAGKVFRDAATALGHGPINEHASSGFGSDAFQWIESLGSDLRDLFTGGDSSAGGASGGTKYVYFE